MIVDIFVTSKNRPEMLRRCLLAISQNTKRENYRLTVVQDGVNMSCHEVISCSGITDHYLENWENAGLGPSINMALAHIQALNQWYGHPTHGDHSKVAPFVCYIQDDVAVSPGWLEKMTQMFVAFESQFKLGFASGVECVEHKTRRELPGGMLLKDWIRAANMFGRREYWMSMFPIPRFDPETGRVRAKPNDGMGSGVDWWFIRDHENSVCQTGRTNLVFPGMMVHMGYNESTWLPRELPESESDKLAVEKVKNKYG